MSDVEVAIIGGGVVGLACAARLSRAGRSVIVIERNTRLGAETTSRNSGVIHAGIYYAADSLKTRLCVEGRERLYARCAREGLPHKKLGKLIIASDAGELGALEAIAARGIQNGAGALRMLEQRELSALEPRIRGVAAVLSPETGIVDAHALVSSYRREAEAHGAEVCVATEVEALEPLANGGVKLVTRSLAGELSELTVELAINCAGLEADKIAALAGLDIDALGYRIHPCKGDYFALASRFRGAVQRLIYPLPVKAGLGVHLTLDLEGMLRAGPDVEYVNTPRYDVAPEKAGAFGAAVRRYLPELRDEDLSPDYAGVRPKVQGPGQAVRDFVIESAAPHGVPGLINLIGIESPGLTASEAIAEHVARIIAAR